MQTFTIVLALFLLQFCTFSLGASGKCSNKGVVKCPIAALNGDENKKQCHVQRKWKYVWENSNGEGGSKKEYRLSCAQCRKQFTAFVYYGENILGGAAVSTCHSLFLLNSISPMPSGADVQFNMDVSLCTRVHYSFNQEFGGYDQEEFDCEERKPVKAKGTTNGWVEETISPKKGVVREINDVTNTASCDRKSSWKHKEAGFRMTCFDCHDDYVAVVYLEETALTEASVDTCDSPFVEHSITVVPRKTYNARDEYRIQFQTKDESCVTGSFTKSKGKEITNGCKNSAEGGWSDYFGYQNGWYH